VTDTPAIGQDPDITDSDQTRALRRKMVTALAGDGTLTDGRWRDAFLTVPRHVPGRSAKSFWLVTRCFEGWDAGLGCSGAGVGCS